MGSDATFRQCRLNRAHHQGRYERGAGQPPATVQVLHAPVLVHAVVVRICVTSSGPIQGAAWSIKATTPETCGAAWLVPQLFRCSQVPTSTQLMQAPGARPRSAVRCTARSAAVGVLLLPPTRNGPPALGTAPSGITTS